MASKLECIVCIENFTNPRVLPCGHSFCEECLERWLLSSIGESQGQTISAKLGPTRQQIRPPNKLSCPECREKHCLPVQGVKGFKKNFALTKADQTPKCTDRKTLSTFLECDGWLYEQCYDWHEQGQKHEPVSIHGDILRESSKEVVGIPQYKSCSHHNNKLIEYFCIKCNVACCHSGYFIKHKFHECVTLNERIYYTAKKIHESSKPDQMEDSWETGMKCKQLNTAEVRDQIINLEKHIVKVVRKCAKKLLDCIQSDEAEFIKTYQKAKQELNKVKEQNTSSESDMRGGLKRRLPQEVYSQEEEMKQKLAQSAVICDLPQPVWNMYTLDQPQVDIETDISKLFGSLIKTVNQEKLSKFDRHFKNEKPVHIKTINVKTAKDMKKCHLWDVAFLYNGNIAVSDCSAGNAKVKVFTPDGDLLLQSNRELFLNPSGMISLPGDRDKLLVIDEKKHKVLSWNMRNQKVMEFVTSGQKTLTDPRGLGTTRSGIQDIIVIADRGARALFFVEVNGHVLQQVKIKDDLFGKNLYFIGGHHECQEVVISCPNAGIAYVKNGQVLWSVDKELPSPRGVILSETGTELIASDIWSNTVVLVSRKGQEMDTLLSADDGINRPMGLAYYEQHHLLAVVEWESQLLKLFQY